MRFKHKKNFFQFHARPVLRGFSLIELMTVTGIIGIMAAIVLVSFSSGRTDEVLKTSAREVANALREAQNDALSGLRPSDVPASRTVCWFSIENSNSTDALLNVYHSNASDCGSGRGSSIVRTLKLQNGATFGSAVSYGFRLPHGNPVSPSDGAALSSGVKTITITAAGKSIAVCLDPASGAIRETVVGAACS